MRHGVSIAAYSLISIFNKLSGDKLKNKYGLTTKTKLSWLLITALGLSATNVYAARKPRPGTTTPITEPAPTAPTAVSVGLVSHTISNTSLIAGQVQNIRVTMRASHDLLNTITNIRIVDGARTIVASKNFSPFNYTAGVSTLFAYDFTVPANFEIGRYSVEIGVWSSNWATTYSYNVLSSFDVTTATVAAPVPAPTPAPAPAPSSTTGSISQRTCTGNYTAAWDPAKTLRASSLYTVENNDWGMENWATSPMTYFMTPITEQPAGWRNQTANQGTKYFQCVGMSTLQPDNSFAASFKWDYPSVNTTAAGEVKGYPQVIFGQKPGYPSTAGSGLPTSVSGLLSSAKTVTSSWVSEIPAATYTSGKGHLSYDIWLQTTPAASNYFDGVDKTHEIMITLDAFQGYGRERWLGFFNAYGTFTISGAQYRLYKAINPFGGTDKWSFIVFQSVDEKRPTGYINMREFLQVLRNTGLITGSEFLASIELGVEPELGSGEVLLKSFKAETK